MSAWRGAVELVVTIVLVMILALAILGAYLVEGHSGVEYFVIGTILILGSSIKGVMVALFRRRDGQYAEAASDAGLTLRLSRPLSDRIAIAVCCWLMTAAFVLYGLAMPDLWGAFLSLLLIVAFGGIAGWNTFALRKAPPTLTLSSQGLDYSVFKLGPIAWPDILAARQDNIGRVKVIALKVADEAKYLPPGRRLPGSRGNRFFLSTPFAVQVRAFDVSPRLIIHAIETRLSKYGRPDRVAIAKTV